MDAAENLTTRQPGESAKAYEAFRCYAEMGEKRTQQAVAKKLKKQRVLIGRWSAKYKWKERIVSWHHEDADRQKKAAEVAALEVARERERRKNSVQDAAWEMYEAMKLKVMAMLNFPVAQQRIESKDGKSITIVEPIRWRFSDVARVAGVADQLARLSTGMSTSNGRLTVQDPMGAPLPPPIQTLIQVAIVRSKDANTSQNYKMLRGEVDEDDEKQAAEA